MTRPVPLFRAPELVQLLEPHALTDAYGIHGDYLATHLSGDVLVVGRDAERLARFERFARALDGVASVATSHNDTGITRQIKAHDLGVGDRRFDTVVYTKEKTSWFGRSRDFQRLTEHVRQDGTMLAKSKWVPDSNRVRLDEVAVAGAPGFELPDVYLRWTKTLSETKIKAGADTSWEAVAADGGTAAAAGQSERAPFNVSRQTRAFESQFPADARKSSFSPGWSWHSPLTEYVAAWLDEHADGPAVNLCSGVNDLGDVRVDKLVEWDDDGETRPTAATHRADATALPFRSDQFAAGVSDPPWKVAPETRVRLFSELVRVVEPGGRVLVNAWWIPHHPYAKLCEVRPVVANVQDDSLGGPGGLSFLAEYEVAEQPAFGDASYTLAEHLDAVGLDALDAYQETRAQHPSQCPANDPRFITPGNPYTCVQCGDSRLAPASLGERILYRCAGCGFPNTAAEVAEGA